MSLHYLVFVKLEILVGYVLPVSCYRKKPQFIPPQLWPTDLPDLNPVDYSVWEYCKKRCTKYASLTWMNWKIDRERCGQSWIMSSLRQPFVSGIV